MPFRPRTEGEFPTLGWTVLDWMMAELASPQGGAEKNLFVPYPEQARFILNLYRLDPITGRRIYRRAGLCRPRGWGKSPLLAAITIAEAIAPVVFDGWDTNGQPIGRPWSRTTRVLTQLGAVSEDQAETNSWGPLLEMVREGPVVDDYEVDPFDTRVDVPGGAIKMITASADTVKGAPAQLCILDQTEVWVTSNGGVKLAKTLRDNAAKVDGITIESPNAFIPGAGSVAEKSQAYAQKILEKKAVDKGLLWDDREAPDVDLGDRAELMEALLYVYGDSAKIVHEDGSITGHVNLDRIADEVNDPERTEDEYRREFLNRKMSTGDSFVQSSQWKACGPHEEDSKFWPNWVKPAPVTATDPVCIGFDGSRRRKKGTTDATALVAVRVSDGFAWPIRVWEEPDSPQATDWEVPEVEVEATLDDFMNTHRVVGFFADPSLWESNVARWEAKYGERLRVGPKAHRIAMNTTVNKVKTSQGIKALRTAILNRELQHDGSEVLTRHVLNAIVHEKNFGPLMYKRTPSSADKIDACYALMLAWRARLEALSVDLTPEPEAMSFIPTRIY